MKKQNFHTGVYRFIALLLFALLLCQLFPAIISTAFAAENKQQAPIADSGWPRIVRAMNLDFIIYQPQVERLENTGLEAYMAIEVAFSGDNEPTYGVLFIKAQVLIDTQSRQVTLDKFTSFDLRMPALADKTPQKVKEIAEALKIPMLTSAGSISLDRLEASLAIGEAEHKGLDSKLQNEAPKIIFSPNPALLVYIDGNPVWRAIPGTKLEQLINTRVFILKDGPNLYLAFLDGYLTSTSLDGPWSVADKAPQGADSAKKTAEKHGQTDFLTGQADSEKDEAPSLKKLPEGKAPLIYVATNPTELVVSQGEPNYTPIAGTNLLYMSNTSANVFKDIKNGKSYILLTGRWFESKSLSGPWLYVSSKNLPKDFAEIPDESIKENVKASVPGTRQAKEAEIASQIPQTAKIKRSSAKFTPVIDSPEGINGAMLVPVEGTNLQYVKNASDPIIMVNASSWFALHNAVWFSANSIKGPWVIAESIPASIYAIPASSPIHYVTYVKIYSITPEYILIGYTPGYYGAILTQDGVVVYGTGYVYTGWVGTYWYGAPMTYGLGVAICWTPWAGWAFDFGFGWYWGGVDYGWWYPPAPWWGPYYYGGVYPNAYGGATAWGPNGWVGTTGNIYSRWGNSNVTQRAIAGENYITGTQFAKSYGMAYNSSTGAVAVGSRGAVENVYSGNYAYGGHGAAVDPSKDIAARGGRVTVGNENTGNSATIGHLDVSKDGQNVNSGWIRGEDGSISHINNNVFGTKDGQVYRYDPSNPDHWVPVTRPSGQTSGKFSGGTGGSGTIAAPGGRIGADNASRGPNAASREGHIRQDNIDRLAQERQARDRGDARAASFRENGASFSHGGGFGGGRASSGGGRHFGRFR